MEGQKMKNFTEVLQFCGNETRVAIHCSFCEKSGLEFSSLATGCLRDCEVTAAPVMEPDSANPFAAKPRDFLTRAKNAIFLFMHSSPSRFETLVT